MKPRTPRSSTYLRWLRTQPCCWCGRRPPSEASHHGRRGMGKKASDLLAISLCSRCHGHHHGPRFGNAPPMPGGPMDLDVREWAAEQAQRLRALFEKSREGD